MLLYIVSVILKYIIFYAPLSALYLWEMDTWVVMSWRHQSLYSAHTESCRVSWPLPPFPSSAPDAISSPAAVPGRTQPCAGKLTHTRACPTLSMLQTAHFTDFTLVPTWGSQPPQPDTFGPYPEPWVCLRRGCEAFLFGMFSHTRDVAFQSSWGAIAVAVPALCRYPPTGHGCARCFDCDDRKCPVDIVSKGCDGGSGSEGL